MRCAQRFLDRGIYGRVSASLFDGKTIPCIDELVNVVVVEGGNLADEGDHARPGSRRHGAGAGRRQVAEAREGVARRYRSVEPVPAQCGQQRRVTGQGRTAAAVEVDRWHDRWARSHMSAVTTISMVTAGGRLYTIEDLETVEYHRLPGKYFLIARDAFNGMELWKRPLRGHLADPRLPEVHRHPDPASHRRRGRQGVLPAGHQRTDQRARRRNRRDPEVL